MLKEKTVFIIGAGASAEFNLPVGTALQRQIANLVDIHVDTAFGSRRERGDDRIFETIRRLHPSDTHAYWRAGQRIQGALGLSQSIDNFIDTHDGDKYVSDLGRLGIARAIAMAEQASTLYIDPSNIYNDLKIERVQDTWIAKLFTAMQEGVRAENVGDFFNNASFIVFNYDRCIEHFFLRALMRVYGLNEETAARIVTGAEIFHPYGTIGPLPWQPHANGQVGLRFGNTGGSLENVARGIKTYTDRIEEPSTLNQIRAAVSGASTLCFLGFSYQPQNMDLLTPTGGSSPLSVLGTAYEISSFNTDIIRATLKTRLLYATTSPSVHITDLKCAAFMQEYDRAFRLG